MRSQIEVQRESFAAKGAFKRLFARVNELVTLQLGVVEELFVAPGHRTDVLALTVRHCMLPQRGRILENFTATEHMTRLDALRV